LKDEFLLNAPRGAVSLHRRFLENVVHPMGIADHPVHIGPKLTVIEIEQRHEGLHIAFDSVIQQSLFVDTADAHSCLSMEFNPCTAQIHRP